MIHYINFSINYDVILISVATVINVESALPPGVPTGVVLDWSTEVFRELLHELLPQFVRLRNAAL